MLNVEFTRGLSECVGLWIAEGDSTSTREITFTNNCVPLLVHFHQNLSKHFNYRNSPRLYEYSPDSPTDFSIEGARKRYYVDKRARKPYYIYRVADAVSLREFRAFVDEVTVRPECFADILRGIIAGEGNIKYDASQHSRTVRIAQKERMPLIEKMLDAMEITYSFDASSRQYEIGGVENMERLEALDLVSLHPQKKQAFEAMMKTSKQRHLPRGELKNIVFELLAVPLTSSALAKKLTKSQARIQEVLAELELEGKIRQYRAYSWCYWVRNDANLLIISTIKEQILDSISDNPKTAAEIVREVGSSYRAVRKRLDELKSLQLVRRDEEKRWIRLRRNEKLIVAGVDEAGSLGKA